MDANQDQDKPEPPTTGAAAAENEYREEQPQDMECDRDGMPDLRYESDTKDDGDDQHATRTMGKIRPGRPQRRQETADDMHW